ncbi:hypothetical protein Rcae01_02592 [Novipirellula caenicola]|uniref:Uncharacterized protein n=1 Tax=Novipirellula caenicola TaxID=1536901 RepID=A0ABP9VPN6_9BACT
MAGTVPRKQSPGNGDIALTKGQTLQRTKSWWERPRILFLQTRVVCYNGPTGQHRLPSRAPLKLPPDDNGRWFPNRFRHFRWDLRIDRTLHRPHRLHLANTVFIPFTPFSDHS